MGRYRITPLAREDLLGIREYVKQESRSAWPFVWAEFKRVFRLIGAAPGVGHFREDLTARPLRFFPVYKYLVVYDPAARPVRVLGVFHSALDLRRDPRLK